MADGSVRLHEDKLASPAQGEYEERLVTEKMQEFSQLNLWRSTTAAHWEEIAELIDPPSRNTFYYGNYNWPGQKKTDRQVDATGMMALGRFGAIMDSLLTPENEVTVTATLSSPHDPQVGSCGE